MPSHNPLSQMTLTQLVVPVLLFLILSPGRFSLWPIDGSWSHDTPKTSYTAIAVSSLVFLGVWFGLNYAFVEYYHTPCTCDNAPPKEQ